jgi:hypothetical protein
MKANQKLPKFALTYDNTSSFDGTGAQIQRILGIYALSKKFNIPYLHSGIKDLIITPLDPFQTEFELQQYLKRVNNYFDFPTDQEADGDRVVSRLQTLSRIKLLEIRSVNKLKLSKVQVVAIANPFKILNKMPDTYAIATKNLNRLCSETAHKRIVVHYRRGSNTLDILPGELAPRGLSNEWYLNTLRKYVSIYQKLGVDFTIEIYTDMPRESFTYFPKEFQSHLWSYEPRLKDGAIEVLGEDVKSTVFAEFGNKLKVHHGGDPLQGLIDMSEADILITSRSSYSYVGGLLNLRGTIIIPPGFWHSKLDSWVLEP